MPRVLALLSACLVTAVALLSPPSASAQALAVDSRSLPRLLSERGLVAPAGFKALVVRLDRGPDGAISPAYFDWNGTSDDREDWWPASSIKIYAAVAALERLHELGFPIRTWLTYHYEDGPVSMRMDQIIRLALERSSNPAFDQLVELVGFDDLNARFFVEDNGLATTVFLRSYAGRNRDLTTGISSARESPAITLRRGRREREVPARHGAGTYDCPDEGNCTTLLELAEAMRRIMLHEHLPESERYGLEEADLVVIRRALATARNYQVAQIVRDAFGDVPVDVWHKPGFAMRWVSDVLFVHRQDTDERWVVAMAAQPDRRALDDAAAHVAGLLRDGALRAR